MTPKEIGPFRCPRCGSVTWGDLTYCLDCGQYLYTECGDCGTSWRYFYEYAYCPSCGKRVKSKEKAKLSK
ncbi:MAG: hypothetical protein ACE5OZ_26205 [Candidatus Heimdallarchaeota archaeon]